MDPPPTHVLSSPDRVRVGEHVVIFRTSRSPRWYAQYSLDGRQHKVSLRTSSLKQARTLAARLDAQLLLGADPERRNRRPRVEDAVEQYLESQDDHVTPRTSAIYRRYLSEFAGFCKARRVSRLDAVTANVLEDFARFLRTPRMPTRSPGSVQVRGQRKPRTSPPNHDRTVRGKLKACRQLLRWALRRRLLDRDPAPGYRLPPEPKQQASMFTAAELRRILDAAKPPFRAIFNFLAVTGLRNDELCWLTKGDVDPQLRFIHIRAKTCPRSGVRWKPKHGNERVVPLCDQARAVVAERLASRTEPWLFAAEHSRAGAVPARWKTWQIWAGLRKVLKATGINHGCVHAFRHSYCSFLANSGVPAFVVMRCLGHSSLSIVLRYYHASEDELLKALADLNFDALTNQNRDVAQRSELVANPARKELDQ